MRRILIPASLLLAACGSDAPPPDVPPPAPLKPAYVEMHGDPAKAKMSAAIDANDLAKHIQTLASDEFEGRGPGSLGERLTLNYFENEFSRIGFLPAIADGQPCKAFPCDGATYFQRVPMVSTTADPSTALHIQVAVTNKCWRWARRWPSARVRSSPRSRSRTARSSSSVMA